VATGLLVWMHNTDYPYLGVAHAHFNNTQIICSAILPHDEQDT